MGQFFEMNKRIRTSKTCILLRLLMESTTGISIVDITFYIKTDTDIFCILTIKRHASTINALHQL